MEYAEKILKGMVDRLNESKEQHKSIDNASNIIPSKLFYENELQTRIDQFKSLELIFPESYLFENKPITDEVKKAFKTLTLNYCFMGRSGVGKTYLMRIIKGGVINVGLKSKTNHINCRNAYSEYLVSSKESKTGYHPDVRCQFLFMDDLGDEKPPTDAAHSWIAGLIQDRFDFWDKHRDSSTIITTNLSSGDLVKFYGERVVDRMADMLAFCKFQNKSFRTRNQRVIEG